MFYVVLDLHIMMESQNRVQKNGWGKYCTREIKGPSTNIYRGVGGNLAIIIFMVFNR